MTCKADGRYASSYSDCGSVPERWVYTYDALNRVDNIDYMATATITPDVNFDYDGPNEKGRLNLVSQAHASGEIIDTQFDYDLFGNLTEQRQYVPDSPAAPDPYVTEYQYDGSDQIEQITYPSGRIVDYVRNSAGRIQQIKSTSPIDQTVTTLVNNVLYKPFGPPTSIAFNNGLFTTRFYDTAYRVTQAGLTDNVPAMVDYHLYTLDPAGNIEQDTDLVNAANSRDYDYDVLDRLTDDTSIDTSPSLDTYVYDGNGNRLQRNSTHTDFPAQSMVYDTGNSQPNRIAMFNGQSVSYDGAGNILLNGRGDSFAYNAGNRLESIASNGDTLTALYNGMGELARTSTIPACPCGGCATWEDYYHFAADGRALGMVQQAFDGWTGNPTSRIERDWIWLDGIPVAQVQESYNSSGIHVATTVTYLHADHLGTPRVGTDPTGTPTWSYLSDAFGKSLPGGLTGASVPLRMPGQIDLGVGGIYYNYFRTYDPSTGRYLESDPIGLPGGLNTYGYANQNPLSFTDPTGEFIPQAVGFAIGAGFEYLTNPCASTSDILVAGTLGALGGGVGSFISRVRNIRQAYLAGLATAQRFNLSPRAAHAARRELGRGLKSRTPEPLRSAIYRRNVRQYDGDPLGPQFDPIRHAEATKTLTDTNQFADSILFLPSRGLGAGGAVVGGGAGIATVGNDCGCK